jgi:hypothetical protein
MEGATTARRRWLGMGRGATSSGVFDSRLESAAAGLLVAVVLVQLPLTLYLGSRMEFRYGLGQMLPVWLALAGAAWLMLLGAARLVPEERRVGAGAAFWAAALWAWVSGNLVIFDFGVLTGEPLEFGSKKLWALPELLLAGAVLVVGFWWARRRPAPARRLALAGLCLIATQALLAVAMDMPKRGPLTPARPSALARFAPDDNVLVILLDTFQGDVFAELIDEDPELAAKFAGFQFFPNTLGVARTTALTMPAVHTGLRFERGWTLDEYMQGAAARTGFLDQAARAGSEVVVVNSFGFCPQDAVWCGELDRLVGSPWLDLATEALLPVDLALFRVAPLVVKRALYGRGHWLVLRLLGVHRGRQQQEQSFGLLRQVASEARIDEGAATVKFLHLPTPHSPLVATSDCELGNEDLAKTRANIRAQSRCALLEVATLLDRLRELGIMESALVIVMADHGAGVALADADAELPVEWRERMGAANPLLVVKFPGASGDALSVSQQPAQIDDVGRTVCDAVEGCGYGSGRPLTFRWGPRRPRRYLDYRWRTDFWYRRGQIEVTEWEVRGPLRKRDSWRAVEPLQ